MFGGQPGAHDATWRWRSWFGTPTCECGGVSALFRVGDAYDKHRALGISRELAYPNRELFALPRRELDAFGLEEHVGRTKPCIADVLAVPTDAPTRATNRLPALCQVNVPILRVPKTTAKALRSVVGATPSFAMPAATALPTLEEDRVLRTGATGTRTAFAVIAERLCGTSHVALRSATGRDHDRRQDEREELRVTQLGGQQLRHQAPQVWHNGFASAEEGIAAVATPGTQGRVAFATLRAKAV